MLTYPVLDETPSSKVCAHTQRVFNQLTELTRNKPQVLLDAHEVFEGILEFQSGECLDTDTVVQFVFGEPSSTTLPYYDPTVLNRLGIAPDRAWKLFCSLVPAAERGDHPLAFRKHHNKHFASVGAMALVFLGTKQFPVTATNDSDRSHKRMNIDRLILELEDVTKVKRLRKGAQARKSHALTSKSSQQEVVNTPSEALTVAEQQLDRVASMHSRLRELGVDENTSQEVVSKLIRDTLLA